MATRKMSPNEFRARFGTEELCRKYVFAKKWPQGFVCPRCGANHCYELTNGNLQCASCHSQTTLGAGTFLNRSHIPLQTWFRVLYLVSYDPNVTAARVQQEAHCTYRSAWFMLDRIRSVVGDGPVFVQKNGTLEFDERFFRTPATQPTAPALVAYPDEPRPAKRDAV